MAIRKTTAAPRRWNDSRSRFVLVSAITAAYFLSGAAALIYEVVWARYLALLLGNDGFAVVIVLATFMGGLAIASAWIGPRADSMRRPLLLFGMLETGIGLYALAFAKYFELLRAGYLGIANPLAGESILIGFRFLVCVVAILPPTILMGATLPVISRFATSSISELGPRVALTGQWIGRPHETSARPAAGNDRAKGD